MSSRLLHVLWLLSILLVVSGSLLPGRSQVMRAVGMLPVSSKVLHFCAYTWLALLALWAWPWSSLRSWYLAGCSKSVTCSSTELESLLVSQSAP
jgi:hypothetical protein